ncbi:MAG: glutamate--tRNA ligase [Candidatus Hodarchaeales archaeon]
MDDKEIVEKYTLLNAVKYNGKAALKSTLGSIIQSDPKRFKQKIPEIKALIEETINRINKLSIEEQKARLLKIDPESLKEEKRTKKEVKIELPDVKKFKKVTLRLAPYPSGPLHIGNSRMVVLNDYLVKKYNGRLLLVFDDTIGSKEKIIDPTAYDTIPEGLDFLGVKVHKKYFKSDRLELFYKYAKDIIEKDKAYVCTCDASVWRSKYKEEKKNCPCRNLPVEDNLERWEKMLDGSFPERAAVVRLKAGMDLPDPAIRDPVMLRISEREHPRVGTKYRVWPLLEFSWGIDDHELGMTHIIRGKDLRKEGIVEEMIWNIYGWKKPSIILYGRMKLKDIKLSKSKSAQLIRDGKYMDWTDPRTWSLQSLQRRGIKAEAIRQALLELGMNPVDVVFSPEQIYSVNRGLIDSEAQRFFMVPNPTKITIKNIPASITQATPHNHPENPNLGSRVIELPQKDGQAEVFIPLDDLENAIDKLIRLKDLFNFRIEVKRIKPKTFKKTKKKLSLESKVMYGVYDSEDLDTARIRKARMVQWVPVSQSVPVEILNPDGTIIKGVGEINLKKTKIGQIIQFERFAFCRIESINSKVSVIWTHK